MNRMWGHKNGGRGRIHQTLMALLIWTVPWVASAMTRDHTAAVRAEAIVFEGGPQLVHTPFSDPVRADYPLSLTLTVNSSTDPIREAYLFYRTVGDSSFTRVALRPPPSGRPGSYTGVADLPPASGGKASYEYYFEVLSGTVISPFSVAWRPFSGGTAILTAATSVTKTIGREGGHLSFTDSFAATGDSKVEVPSGALPGSAAVSLGLMVSGRASAAMATPVAGRLPITGLSLSTNPNGVFHRPVLFSMAYKDLDNDGRVDIVGADESLLQPAWFDGVGWRALPRLSLDPSKNVLTFSTSLTGLYALFPSNSISISQRPQEKIISPNGDGKNDAALFDGVPTGTRIVIMDVRGRVVRELSDQTVWDGRDRDGKIVESGLYVYQAHTDEGLLSGTIAVAR